MRELEASLQQFGEFVLKAQLMKASAAPYCVRWVRQFLTRLAANEPLADQVRRFCEELERHTRSAAGFALASRAGRNPEGRLNLISTSASPAYKTFARSFRDSTQKLPRAVRPNQNRYGIRPI